MRTHSIMYLEHKSYLSMSGNRLKTRQSPSTIRSISLRSFFRYGISLSKYPLMHREFRKKIRLLNRSPNGGGPPQFSEMILPVSNSLDIIVERGRCILSFSEFQFRVLIRILTEGHYQIMSTPPKQLIVPRRRPLLLEKDLKKMVRSIVFLYFLLSHCGQHGIQNQH
jgi:hypothetical protein